MNRDYKIAEIKSRYERERLIDKVRDYIETDYENFNSRDLLDEILELRVHGCQSLNDYSDDDLAEQLIDYIDRSGNSEEIEDE